MFPHWSACPVVYGQPCSGHGRCVLPYGGSSYCDCFVNAGYTGADCSTCAPGFAEVAIDGTCQPAYATAFYYPAPAAPPSLLGLSYSLGAGAIAGIVIAGVVVLLCVVMRVRYSIKQEQWRMKMQQLQKDGSGVQLSPDGARRPKSRFIVVPTADPDSMDRGTSRHGLCGS